MNKCSTAVADKFLHSSYRKLHTFLNNITVLSFWTCLVQMKSVYKIKIKTDYALK